ncbi:MAG: methylated-DNA--[protein]-cysteine S-methyltransferase [Xanthomonadales bacterium]|nr:methylated-DNA--[protein]-cysteine S-methyltransferase [Xanthomonadales bacterium]
MNDQFELVSRILRLLADEPDQKWSLPELSDHFGVSAHHLQRTFRRFVGVSPKKFQQFLDKQRAVARLKEGQTVLDTALDLGLSGPGRLHDLLVTAEAITPGEARALGRGVRMTFGSGLTPLGPAILAWTGRGITFLGFAAERPENEVCLQLKSQWPRAEFDRDDTSAQLRLDTIFALKPGESVAVWLRGSPFQIKVWEALLEIPPATRISYGQLARRLGKPGASRAVGSAIGRNPVAWLIPCHRVITSLGTPGGYRWGVKTKMIMNSWESGQARGAA